MLRSTQLAVVLSNTILPTLCTSTAAYHNIEYKKTVTTASACFVFAVVGSQAAHDDSEQRQREHWTARRGVQPVFGCKYGQRSCPFGNDLFTATLTQRVHRLLFKKDFSRARPCVRELDPASGVKFRWF